MTDYYQILGLSSGATIAEIKAAFRALAKQYHPDKNPAGQDHFRKILLAYETLSDPGKKHAYDLRIKYREAYANNAKTQYKKNWTFEEKEMRRRQYYNEHIKKYEKKSRAKEEHAELKSNYNEFKYILFATPLAVLLFLLVINFASRNDKKAHERNTENSANSRELKAGESPYASYFGGHVYDTLSDISLNVKNNTGKGVIVCLFAKSVFVRGCFIADGYAVEIGKLPNAIDEIRYSSGHLWDPGLEIKDVNILGGFTKDAEFYRAKSDKLNRFQSLTLLPLAEDFEKIDVKEFFKKEKHDKKN